MQANRDIRKAQQYRNEYDEYADHFVDSKANNNYKKFAKRQANKLERRAGKIMARNFANLEDFDV